MRHRQPTQGLHRRRGHRPSPTDRGKLGWKWSLFADRNGIPLGWATAGANRHDAMLVEPTLLEVTERALIIDTETLHLDRGYDNGVVRAAVADFGIDDLIRSRRRHRGTATGPKNVPLGTRWPIECTNSWLSNFGQLRRKTDRRSVHRLAQLALAFVVLIIAKLIDWRNRWSPESRPIR